MAAKVREAVGVFRDEHSLEGTVDEAALAGGPLNLAIAVNGRIEAVTRTYRPKPLQQQRQALVPESAIREGYNELRVFVVRSHQSTLALEPTITSQ